ncbi:MAG: acyltransferase family protein [Candidatus Nanopelagicales bacterium]
MSERGSGAFPLLDGYRAIAAFMVLTTHVAFNTGEILTPVIGPLMGRMDFGVTLFFLLSGFLLYRPWARAAMTATPAPRLGTYALRRAARILPAYWVMVVVTLLLLPDIQPVRWQAWPVHLGLLHIYIPGFTLEGLTQTWSLATEVAFYILLPVLAWVAGRRQRGDASASARWQLIVLLGCVALAWTYTVLRVSGVFGNATITGYWLPGFLDWFALGMAAAVIQVRLQYVGAPRWMWAVRQVARATPWCLVIAVSLYVVAATPLAGPLTFDPAQPHSLVIKHVLYGAIAAFLLLPGFLGEWGESSTWARVLRNPVVVYLGTISYGVFLWHLVLLRFIQDGLGLPVFGGGFWIVWPLVVVASVIVASISWFSLERPLQAWSHRPQRVSVASVT